MIAITGATGFLGGHVARRLAAVGLPVRALVRGRDETIPASLADADVVPGSLQDHHALAELVRDADAVVHLASKTVDHDGTGFAAVNVEGTKALARAAAEAGVRRFVYGSTVGVYGHGAHLDAGEETPLAPDTPFSRSKAAAEAALLELDREGRLEAVILRPRFVYGAGDESVIPRLMKAARSYPFWVNRGRARLSLLHAGDFAEIVLRVAREPAELAPPGERIFHATSGEAITYRSVIETLCAAFGYRPPRVSLPLFALLWPLLARERLLGLDPETVEGISSLRVRMVAQHNSFSNARLSRRFPDLELAGFATGLARCRAYYERFA